jgi:hypothetical protein
MTTTEPRVLPYGQQPAARRIAQVNAGPRVMGDLNSLNHLVAGYYAATVAHRDCSRLDEKP